MQCPAAEDIEKSEECKTLELSDSSPLCEDNQNMQEEMLLKPNLPNANVPEKIILGIDVCFAEQLTVYRLADGTVYSPINMIKKILEFFVHLKLSINSKTQFALMIMKNDEVMWLTKFTSNIKDIIHNIDSMKAVICTCDTFDFTEMFDLLLQEITIPEYNDDNLLPPPYIVRCIILYGRSNCIPQIPSNTSFNLLKSQTYFFIDILLLHDEDCVANNCEKIYDILQNFDNGYSYVFEVSRNATKAHDCMAKLLAHPLQRPLQKNTKYTFPVVQSIFA